MNYEIAQSKLQSIFNKVMEEDSKLAYTRKSYDYWDHDLSNYTDLDVINFYENIDEDYEDDNWLMQYQEDPDLIHSKIYKLPILRISWYYKNKEAMFGEHFLPLFKNWFETNYNLPVNTIIFE